MTLENKEVLRDGWYWSRDGENFEINEGAFETVEKALNYLKSKSFSGSKPSKIYLIYGDRIELKLASKRQVSTNLVSEFIVRVIIQSDYETQHIRSKCSIIKVIGKLQIIENH